ncbi:MAG: putative addiction module antidote protein [Desulfuromonadaceae bacterium GWC2_58_13]|nr:MAG: putative addiction module antidote protein [Desulfuromonadaceae bacterium GWC2_58_13]HAD04172.1 putative addiction module antidote protein [Desulfuromonas sp.]
MAGKTVPYEDDLNEWLKSPENAAVYLAAILEEGEDLDALLLALRDVAKAQGGMAAVAERAHVRRETLYKMLAEKGNPSFKAIAGVLHGMGLKLSVTPERLTTP